MQQTDFFGFSRAFPESDAQAILGARLNVRFDLSNGFGILRPGDDVSLIFKSGSGMRTYELNFAKLCDLLREPPIDDE
ncbi:hypothetical protein [Duganella phyllosphaerae]|uniref:Uncharacterized protein n=1 Tax=Duganella phyllosphaerae TaxID=762836 RepID=A0A1E7W649_9BURK|nr:hypothetical protein [Duganella phyllosphaerae]OEZ91474.1 hypothetical protein DUPY_50860 [Duganella phyllosphaerae]